MNYSNMTREELEAKWPIWPLKAGVTYPAGVRDAYVARRKEALAEWDAANQEEPFWTEDPKRPGRLVHERWSWRGSSLGTAYIFKWGSPELAMACRGVRRIASERDYSKSEAQAWIEARKKELAAEQAVSGNVHTTPDTPAASVVPQETVSAEVTDTDPETGPKRYWGTHREPIMDIEQAALRAKQAQETCPEVEKVDRPWDAPGWLHRDALNHLADRLDALEKRMDAAAQEAAKLSDWQRDTNKRLTALEAQPELPSNPRQLPYVERLERMVAAVASGPIGTMSGEDVAKMAAVLLEGIAAHLAKEGE